MSIHDQHNRQDSEQIVFPEDVAILPLRNTVAFPFGLMPLMIGIPRSIKLVEDALREDRMIGLLTAKDAANEKPSPGEVFETGTIARIHKVMRIVDEGTLQIVVEGVERFRVDHWLATEPYLKAAIRIDPEPPAAGVEIEAFKKGLGELIHEIVAYIPSLKDTTLKLLSQTDDPRYLAYTVAGNLRMEPEKAQQILELDDVREKMKLLMAHLTHEREVLSLEHKIRSQTQEKMTQAQKEYYLRERLKAIRKELGETDEAVSSEDDYEERIQSAELPEEAEKEARRELKRLSGMSPHAAEYTLVKSYLDWLVDLPWNHLSDEHLDLSHARQILDEDHYGLQEVKDRIVEYLAVSKLRKERGTDTQAREEGDPAKPAENAAGAILCFVGPPGVGKTSLGQSIARALGREFTRMSLGGVRDEAEIRGHRRTYIGAMPGRIIQAIKRAGTRNPVFMLDEVDKIGQDWRGDPASALLEVLDPAQNGKFRDHYLDVDFDLGKVMFITTANQLETIPAPLRDRMEIISLEGYTEYEKIEIARRYLVPRQVTANGLREDEIAFEEEALQKIIVDYTREAGVRGLERLIGTICRKSAVKIVGRDFERLVVDAGKVRTLLKKERFESECQECVEVPGIATGLAVTATGGDILFIEAARMKGKEGLRLTGQLGEVMRESAQIAYSYVRSKAGELGIQADVFENADVHVHVPAGAVPKDGPSAGLALVLAFASLFSGRPVRGDLGVTGEVTLRGRVLPVGGIKMKVLAAKRAGLKTVILPKRNERDLEDLPDEIRDGEMEFILAERIDDVLETALRDGIGQTQTCDCSHQAA